MDPCLIVGLGNPGQEYAGTRHNLGFDVVDLCALKLRYPWRPGKGDYLIAGHSAEEGSVIFAKPLTYMNNSGSAVADLLNHYPVSSLRLLVVVDDLALPLGSIRMRPRGSDGGHNGLHSIIYHLGSDEFPRLRCGIGREEAPSGESLPGFVLSRFEPGERVTVTDMVERAAGACMEFAVAGIERAMNRFNT